MDYVEQRMVQEAAKQAARQVAITIRHPSSSRSSSDKANEPSSTAFATPLNFILLSLVLYTCYTALLSKPSSSSITLPKPPPPTVFRTYTPHTLLPFNGEPSPSLSSPSSSSSDGLAPVYLAVRGRVFDVSRGRNFYGPGGPYANFAGRDASRGLACGSFDEDMLTKDLDGPLDDLKDLGPQEMEALRGWEERFTEKYDVVGRLVSVGEYDKETAAAAAGKKD